MPSRKFSRGLYARACPPGAPVACACSLLLGLCFNAGRGTESSSEQVIIVLALSCYGNGYRSEASATAFEERRPQFKSSLNPVVVRSAHTGCRSPTGTRYWAHLLRQCHAYGYGGSRVPGSWRSLSGVGVEVEVAEVGAPEQKKVRCSLLRNPNFGFF